MHLFRFIPIGRYFFVCFVSLLCCALSESHTHTHFCVSTKISNMHSDPIVLYASSASRLHLN